jgi:rare lipoprotein A
LTYKGKSVIVTINDRGPFIKNRTFDISKGAAKRLKCMGVCRMQYQKVR